MSVTSAEPKDNAYWAHDGKRFRRHRFSRPIENEIRALNKLDNWHAPLAYAGDLVVIAAAVVLCVYGSWWFYPISLILIGSRQRAFSNLQHESAHEMLAKNKVLNLALGTCLTAYPIFQQHYAYKRSHVATHHPRLGDPDRDPDLKFFIGQGVYEAASKRELWIRLVILPALGSKVISHFWFLVKDRILLNRRTTEPADLNDHWRIKINREKIAFSLFWLIVIASAWASGLWPGVLLFWIVPYLTSFQVIGWYIELAEHTPMVRLHNIDLYMTRNRKSRGLEKFLTGTYADHYHLDHHLDTRTPYWNLRKAHLIRLQDPDYALLDQSFGGLFTSGVNGQPSAIVAIIRDLSETNGRVCRPVLAGNAMSSRQPSLVGNFEVFGEH